MQSHPSIRPVERRTSLIHAGKKSIRIKVFDHQFERTLSDQSLSNLKVTKEAGALLSLPSHRRCMCLEREIDAFCPCELTTQSTIDESESVRNIRD